MNLLRVSSIKIWMAFLVQSITLCSKSVSKPWVHLILLESTFPLVDFHVQALLSIIHQMAKHFWTTETIWKRKYFMKKKTYYLLISLYLTWAKLGRTKFCEKKILFSTFFFGLPLHSQKYTGNASSNSIFASWKELSLFFSLS